VSYADGSAYVFKPVLRHTVYVKQPDIYPDSGLKYRPRRFSIRYPASSCTISEVRLRSGLASWEEGEPGECGIWLDSVDEAAVMMFNVCHRGRPKDSFAILLRMLSDDSARVDIATPTTDQGLSEVLDLFKKQVHQGLRTDRIFRYSTRWLVSAALRPRAVSGEKQFLVDVKVSGAGDDLLRSYRPVAGPAKPADHQDCSDHQEYRIVDQISGYAPLRLSPQIDRVAK
jgi:hypothetical protein